MPHHGEVSTADVARPRRGRQTLSDMARSLGLMAVVIAALLFLGPARALIFPGADHRAPVDYSHQVAGFTTVSGVRAAAPSSLPASWTANAAQLSSSPRLGETLHIGWATPGSRFAGVDESTGDPALLVRSVLGRRGATVVGERLIAGALWDVRQSYRGERAFTRSFGAVLVVVTGNATDQQLVLLAASLA
jgi:hypothetical protein